MRRAAWTLAVGLLACTSDTASSGSSETAAESTGDDDEAPERACVKVLDPSTYADGPVVSPQPWVASEECPALAGPLTLELPIPVEVSGNVVVDGMQWPARVEFHGRAGQGIVSAVSKLDEGFRAELLPGRYDVHVALDGLDVRLMTLVSSDVELVEPTTLELEPPAPIQVTGSMTMDGEPAPDRFGYIKVLPSDSDDYALLIMEAGDYALTLSPGEYRFVYAWCNRSELLPFDAWTFCAHLWSMDPPIPVDAPRIGPTQTWAPFRTVTLEHDDVLDLDVPTARVSGRVTLDGAPSSTGHGGAQVIRLALDEPGSDEEFFSLEPSNTIRLDDDGRFDARIVRADYRAVIEPRGGRLPELDFIDQDIHVEVGLESVVLHAEYPSAQVWEPTGRGHIVMLHLWRADVGGQEQSIGWGAPPGHNLPPVWPGVWHVALSSALCWPDALSGHERIRIPIFRDLELYEPVDLGAILPELAAVHVDIVEVGEHVLPPNENQLWLELIPEEGLVAVEGFVPADGHYDFGRAPGQDFDLHGYVVAGRYQVRYAGSLLGTVDITQGTTLQVRPRSQVLEAEWTIGGAPAGSASVGNHLFMRNLDTGHLRLYRDVAKYGPNTLAPGRYELIYVGWSEYGDGFPDNTDPRLGCITVEG